MRLPPARALSSSPTKGKPPPQGEESVGRADTQGPRSGRPGDNRRRVGEAADLRLSSSTGKHNQVARGHLSLIHPSAWNGDSANFALKGFSELRVDGVLRTSQQRINFAQYESEVLCPQSILLVWRIFRGA